MPGKRRTEQALKEIRETIKTAVLGKNYTVLNFEDGFKVFSDSLINDYKKQNADIISHFGTEKIASLNWEYQTTGKFTGSRGRYTTYTVDKYSYTGGAHGMPWTTNYVFDLRDGHIVDESEIFTDDYKPLLSELLTAHARDNAENPENMTLFVSEVEPNGNFEVSEDGITYIYNPYDIAPYSEGIISITIPWKELKSILK